MIDLYAAGTSNGIRARIALEECGLAYKLHPIALEKGENKTPQFMALNPNAQIPVIVDHEGPGGKPVTVSQSSAILVYAAEKSGKFIPKDPAARPAFWQALMSASTDITPTLGSIFQIVRSKEPAAGSNTSTSGTSGSASRSTPRATSSRSRTSRSTPATRAARPRCPSSARAFPTSSAGRAKWPHARQSSALSSSEAEFGVRAAIGFHVRKKRIAALTPNSASVTSR